MAPRTTSRAGKSLDNLPPHVEAQELEVVYLFKCGITGLLLSSPLPPPPLPPSLLPPSPGNRRPPLEFPAVTNSAVQPTFSG